ncbi:MAG TPA: transglutaminase domain-containing protein [Dehalococcoidia bacterium]|nr:transglutaminase domain-containing protein [Dehalococcoidia bacterium]
MDSFEEYLQPTALCNFDETPEIQAISLGLTGGLLNKHLKLDTLYRFVKELDYVYDDWYVKASDTLREKAGMCSGKTNLLIAMLRSIGIPARYRIFKVEAELMLFEWITRQDERIGSQMGEPYQEQDHVLAEVYIDGWEAFDTSRDTLYEAGLTKLGIPLELKPVSLPGTPRPLVLASFDDWASERQERRRLRGAERTVFSLANQQIEKIRLIGRSY